MSMPWPPRSSGAPKCGVPRNTSARRLRSHRGRASLPAAHARAQDQPAHAVADQHELAHRHRPGRYATGRAAPRGPRRSSRRGAPCCSERRAHRRRGRAPAPAPWSCPSRRHMAVVEAQAVHQHDEALARVRHAPRDRVARERQRHAADAELHRDRQRIAARFQAIAEHAVQGRDDGVAAGQGESPDRAAARAARRAVSSVAPTTRVTPRTLR